MDIDDIRRARTVLVETIGVLVGEFSKQTDVIVRVRVQPHFVDTTEIGDQEPRQTFVGYRVEVEGEI